MLKSKTVYISIIIPLYNAEDVLERCMRSWALQTNQIFELLFVDDGSTDSSYWKLKNLQKQYRNSDFEINIFHEEHKGVSHARNRGLMNAKGNIIGFCDVDDVVHKSMIEFVKRAFDQTNSDIVCTYMKSMNEDDIDIYFKNEFEFKGHQCINEKVFKKEICFNGDVFGAVWNKFIKREIALSKEFDETLSMCEDTHYIYKLLNSKKGLKIYEVTVPLYGYLKNNNSVTHDVNKLFNEDGKLKYCIAIEKIKKECAQCSDEQKWLNAKQFELISGVCVSGRYRSNEHLKQLWNDGKLYLKDYILCNGYSLEHRIKRMLLYGLCRAFSRREQENIKRRRGRS